MKRLIAFLLPAVLLLSAASGSWAQIGLRAIPTPTNAITYGGSGYTNQPNAAQQNANVVSPFNDPYDVIPTTGTVSANSQSAAVRLRNRQALNQFFTDTGVTLPGAMMSLGSFWIEVCGQPSDLTLTNQSSGSVDFRNTSAKSGSRIIAEPQSARIYAFDCHTPTAPMQSPIVLIGGRAQDMTLSAQAYVAPTVDPVVSNASATFDGAGNMTVTTTLINHAGGSISTGTGPGAIQAGQYVVPSPGSGSTLPIGCFVVSQTSGTTGIGGGAVYVIDGGPIASPHSCQTYNNGTPQTVYLGQAAEVANDGYYGNAAFSVFCATSNGGGGYDLYATKVATGFNIPPVNATTYGSCTGGNSSFQVNWRNIRADAVSYRMWDMQAWNTGTSGDFFGSMYFGNNGADINMCGVESKYFMTGLLRNCESSNYGAVESADYLNPNITNNGAQTNLIPVADWYQVGGNVSDTVGTWHFESNSYNCTGKSWDVDNAALLFQGSDSDTYTDVLQPISTTLSNCTHFAVNYIYDSSSSHNVHLYIGDLIDSGTTGSGSWTLGGAALAAVTSRNATIYNGNAMIDQVQTENTGSPAISAQTYQLPTNDQPVLRRYGANVINNSAPLTITDATANNGAGIVLNPPARSAASVTTGSGINFTQTTNTTDAPVGLILSAVVTNTAMGAGASLLDIKAGSAGSTDVFNLSPSGTLAVGFGLTAAGNGPLTFSGRGIITSPTTGSIQLGAADVNGATVNQILRAQSGITGTDLAGATLLIQSGDGTGAGTASTMTLKTSHATTTGTTTQTMNTQIAMGDNTVAMPNLASSSAATTGTVCWTTSTGNLTVDTTVACLASDLRTKTNVTPLDFPHGSALDEIMALKPISYDNKPTQAAFKSENLGRQVGLGAQDVIKVDPRLVSLYASGPDEGTPQGVRYMQLTAVLVKAMQQQEAEIKELKAELKALRTHH